MCFKCFLSQAKKSNMKSIQKRVDVAGNRIFGLKAAVFKPPEAKEKESSENVVIDLIAEEKSISSSSSSLLNRDTAWRKASSSSMVNGGVVSISLLDDDNDEDKTKDQKDSSLSSNVELDAVPPPLPVEDSFILPVQSYQVGMEILSREGGEGSVAKVKALLQDLSHLVTYQNHKIDINKCLTIDKGVTPLILAAKCQNFPLVKYYIEELKADVNITSRTFEESALGWTALNLDVATADYLIAKGADVNVINNLGQSPIMFATKNADYDFVLKLVEKGADCSVRDKDGNTLLILAALSGSLKLLDFFVNNGLDLNAQNHKGETVLMKVAKVQNKKNVLLHLLDKKVDFDIQDNEGKTVLDVASKGNRPLLVSKMRERETKDDSDGHRSQRRRSEDVSSSSTATPAQTVGSKLELAVPTTPAEKASSLFAENPRLHELDRIRLFEGKAEAIEHFLPTPELCNDLIVQLEYTVSRVKERKSSLEEAERQKKRKAMEEEDANTCVLCLDAKKEAVATPCGHISMCLMCLAEVMQRDRKCPICRVKITKYYKIYN